MSGALVATAGGASIAPVGGALVAPVGRASAAPVRVASVALEGPAGIGGGACKATVTAEEEPGFGGSTGLGGVVEIHVPNDDLLLQSIESEKFGKTTCVKALTGRET